MEGIDIKIARLRAGLHQYRVAGDVGIPPSRLSEIESGRQKPSPKLLERILEFIGEHGSASEREA